MIPRKGGKRAATAHETALRQIGHRRGFTGGGAHGLELRAVPDRRSSEKRIVHVAPEPKPSTLLVEPDAIICAPVATLTVAVLLLL